MHWIGRGHESQSRVTAQGLVCFDTIKVLVPARVRSSAPRRQLDLNFQFKLVVPFWPPADSELP